MSTTTQYRPDCTEQCKSKQHGDIITAALTKRGVTDTELCAYLNYVCTNCESVRDSHGRTALHVAASCGRNEVIKWLVKCRRANINVRDEESGYTALHRSIFYGKIDVAIQLIQLGADTSIQDYNSLLPLEHASKDNIKPDQLIQDGELYVWGSNVNNALGPHSKPAPELYDAFHKEYPHETVQQICIEQFHSIIVSASGKVYSCGHGQGGRLGLGLQYTVVSPKLVTFPPESHNEPLYCVEASISRNHSLFLMSDGKIYVCGLNAPHKILGLNPPPVHVLTPKVVKCGFKEGVITGVRSGRFHSVAWGPKCLYTWGLNAGQIGHKLNQEDDKYVITPKYVGLFNLTEAKIRAVSSSDCAIAVCTDRGDIYILHEYQCRKIASRQLNVTQLSVIGGKLNATALDNCEKIIRKNEPGKELKVVALTVNGTLLLWQESDPQLCRCIFSINREIIVKQVVINFNEVLFVTNEGEAYQGLIKPRKKKSVATNSNEKQQYAKGKSAFHEFLEKEFCIVLKLSKCSRIHRATRIESNAKGTDYCVIQAFPYKLYSLPSVEESQFASDFKRLLSEACDSDEIHDIIFKIGTKSFSCHKYIILQRCPELISPDCAKIIEFKDVNPLLFEQFLSYIYTNTCELLTSGPCPANLTNLFELTKDKSPQPENKEVECFDENISAFEAYKTIDRQAKKSKRMVDAGGAASPKNPVRMLHELAKKMGFVELQKEASNYDMVKDQIRVKDDYVESKRWKALKFDRLQLSELYDVTIVCKDNLRIKAHKCVLAARLEYFNNMFSTRWVGSNTTSEVNLPFPKGITETLVDYLYTDTLSCLADNFDTDHLFKVLILADQLFVTRLKEQCELQLSQLLTLKNAVQLLSFSYSYNANKLKTCALSFIVRNMPAFLESRSMEELDEEILSELTRFYYETIQAISCRVITPYSKAVSDEVVTSVNESFPIDLDEVQTVSTVKGVQKRRSRTHRTSLAERNDSTSDDSCLILQFPDDEGSNVKTISSPPINERLRAITLAESTVKDEKIVREYTILNKGVDFPELNNSCSSSPPVLSYYAKSPPSQKYSSKIVKLSQKQRKRLSSFESATTNNNNNNNIKESPKNPWKIIPDSSSPIVSPDFNNMSEIIMDEKKQKENLVKIKSKLLFHTQIEDKAILELHKFYNTEEMVDELITIERVDIGTIASPVWVPKNIKIM